MSRRSRNNVFFLLLISVLFGTFQSCVSVKKIKYFNDIPDSLATPYVLKPTTPYEDIKIQSSDVLAVTVQAVNQNIGTTTGTSAGASNLTGFLVDKDGYIELQLIGFVKVAGLTTTEAKELIKLKATEYLKDPVVSVKIINFDVQMLGEVARAGNITMVNEKASILDAIALSGDLPLTARRDNVLLIRTEGNSRKFVRLDLNSSKIFQSEYFYLKQRDIIYVEPSRYRIQSSDNTVMRNLGYITAVISVLSIAAFLLKK